MSKKKETASDLKYHVFVRYESEMPDYHWLYEGSHTTKESAEESMQETELEGGVQHIVILGTELPVREGNTVTHFDIDIKENANDSQ